jgi:MATE family multidrug resistance protein
MAEATQNLPIEDLQRDPARWWGMGEVVRLSIPAVLSTVSFSIMQFVDRLMVSMVNPESLSAQAVAGLWSFVPLSLFMGVLGCVSTFASQNLGAGQKERAALYGWQGLWLSWIAAAGLALLILPARWLFTLFPHEEAVINLETAYFRILIAGSVFALSSNAITNFFLGIHKPVYPLISGVAGNVVNFVVAYVLIFGKLGMPQLGLKGAGIASVVGSAVQMLVLFGVFGMGKYAREYQVWRQWRLSGQAMLELLKIGIPAGAMFLGDILMWALFMAYIIGGFGLVDLTAGGILFSYWQFCFMPALGVGFAAAAIVGRCCGARQPWLAWRRAHAALIQVEVYMVSAGVFMWLFRDGLVRLFNEHHDPAIQAAATKVFIFMLICQAFDALNVIFIGALRGAGDTLWPGIMQLALAYVLGIGGSAFVAWTWPEWGTLGPWSVATAYIMLLGLVMWVRFLRGKWKSMTVVKEPAMLVVTDEAGLLPPP